jgi:hypothetical protein
MLTNLVHGLTATVRNYRLVLIIWAWHLALAAVAALPALTWWRRALNHSVEAATLLRGFNFAALADVTKYDYVGAFGLLTMSMTGAALVSVVTSPFVMGGILNVLSNTDSRQSPMLRFFGGGGRFFWRFFRLMLIGGTCALVVGAVLMVTLAAVESPLVENGLEATGYLWLLFNLIVLAVACGLFLLALDYARIEVAVADSRGVTGAYFRSLGFVVRHAATVYGMATVVLVLVGTTVLGYLAYETLSPVASSWRAIVTLLVIQQTVFVTRVGLRVSLVDAEFRFAARLRAAATVERRPARPDVSPALA